MLNLYLSTWRKAFTWNGRANRKEYWLFMLVTMSVAMLFLGVAIHLERFAVLWGYGIWIVLCLLPSLAVTIRRLHDINLSGWWVLIFFAFSAVLEILWHVTKWDMWLVTNIVAVVSNVAWLAAMLWKGNKGDNRFGPPPGGKIPQAPTPEAYRQQIDAMDHNPHSTDAIEPLTDDRSPDRA
jgi:uncharacterized membrane protein YhaH (DUF805 family)